MKKEFRKCNRLYVTGEGEMIRHHIATSQVEVMKELSPEEFHTIRVPNPDDLRMIWSQLGLSQQTSTAIARKFGVSRQAVLTWREKAGIKEQHVHLKKRASKQQELAEALRTSQSVAEAAKLAGVSFSTAHKAAEKLGIEFASQKRKRPDDAEIVKLAEGKTWRELADACGIRLQTLRHYVYGNEKLATKVRKKIRRQSTGQDAHGRIDVEKLVELHKAGASAYQIARHFGVETPSVMYWIRKLELRKKGETDAGNAA